MTIFVLGLAATLTRGDAPCPCSTTTTAAPCSCNCGDNGDGSGSGGDGGDASFNQGLINYWPFDNDMNDRIGVDNIQLCIGDWNWDVDRTGADNTSLTFVHAFCTLPSGTYLSGPFSIAMWVKLPDTNQDSIELLLLSSNIYTDAIEIAVSWDSGSPAATFMIQQDTPIIAEVIGNTVLTLNDWVHITATFDGMTAKLYVNGDLDCETNASAPFFGAYRNANAFGGGNSVSVSYDDVRIYGRELSSDEVSALFQSPNTPPSDEQPETNSTQCNDEPVGYCSNNCQGQYDYYLHSSSTPCPYGQRCCVEAPAQDTNDCTTGGGFCVQRDACRISDLMYIGGCDSGSVIPICCVVPNYYNTPTDPFSINDNNGTHCYGFSLGCNQPSDCCSDNCMIGSCE